MRPIVEAGLIGGGAAVVSSALTGIITFAITKRQVTSSEKMARSRFLQEHQANAYVLLADHIARAQARAIVVRDLAKGRPSTSLSDEYRVGDDWYAMAARLMTFGSLPIRLLLPDFQTQVTRMEELVNMAAAGTRADDSTVDALCDKVLSLATKLSIAISADVGPLGDEMQVNRSMRDALRGNRQKTRAEIAIEAYEAEQKMLGSNTEPRDDQRRSARQNFYFAKVKSTSVQSPSATIEVSRWSPVSDFLVV